MENKDTEFYATVKLKNSEEIFSMISPSVEGDNTYLILLNPVVIEEINIRGQSCYKINPWLKTSSSDMVVINMNEVLTIVESSDEIVINMYNAFLMNINSSYQKQKLSRKMGYIANITNAREFLEKLYKS